jgi:hypothetical protein
MGLYKQKINPRTGQFNLVPSYTVVHFKDSVTTYADLPLTGNAIGDGRIANDTGHLYIWSKDAATGLLTDWADQGDIITVDHALLDHLDFSNAGHTGFQEELVYVPEFKAYEIE